MDEKIVENKCVIVSNYATHALKDTLEEYGDYGYSLISAVMAKDSRYAQEVMYLFFNRKIRLKGENNE